MRKHIVESEEKAATNKTRQSVRPRTHLSQHLQLPFDPYAFRCTEATDATCENRTALFAQHIIAELHRSLNKAAPCEDANVAVTEDADTTTTHPTTPASLTNPACLVMSAKVRTLRQTDGPFREHRVGTWLPLHRLLHKVLNADGTKTRSRGQRTCAIVASAGSLSRSGLGDFIGTVRFCGQLRFECV